MEKLWKTLSFLRGGDYYYPGGNLGWLRGGGGRYWEGMINSNTGAYVLYFDSSFLLPGWNYDKGYGSSIRCVVR